MGSCVSTEVWGAGRHAHHEKTRKKTRHKKYRPSSARHLPHPTDDPDTNIRNANAADADMCLYCMGVGRVHTHLGDMSSPRLVCPKCAGTGWDP